MVGTVMEEAYKLIHEYSIHFVKVPYQFPALGLLVQPA